jgi:hypothetical protein
MVYMEGYALFWPYFQTIESNYKTFKLFNYSEYESKINAFFRNSIQMLWNIKKKAISH